MNAVDTNNYMQLDELLKDVSGHDLDFNTDFFSPLSKAAYRGHYQIAKQLLCAGVSVNFCDVWGRTPLMFAAAQNNTDICRLLLTWGSNIHATDSGHYKQTALHYAVQERKCEAAMLLVEHGAIVFDPSIFDTSKPLHILATVIHSPMVLHSFLNHCSANIYSRMPKSLSYLFDRALRKKQEGSAIIVLQNGYYPVQEVKLRRHSYKHHTSCFNLAARYGMIELMSMLIELNSQFMQENWLVEEVIPPELARLPEFASYLVESRKQPSLLVKLCKSTILKRLDIFHKTYYMSKITDLPLPKSLKTFLATVAMSTNRWRSQALTKSMENPVTWWKTIAKVEAKYSK